MQTGNRYWHLVLVAKLLLLTFLASVQVPTPVAAGDTALAPASGFYLGAGLEWGQQTPARYNRDLGLEAGAFGLDVPIPLGPDGKANLTRNLTEISSQGAMAIVTALPVVPLTELTSSVADEFATHLALLSTRLGVPVFVRFAPEMNGSWIRWGQQPDAYVAAFRIVAAAVHHRAPDAAMVWEPVIPTGYPFAGGTYTATPSGSDAAAMDTNGDGQVTTADDPYQPFYPGDDVVDWVGLRLVYWGNDYPYGENESPAAELFSSLLHGGYAPGGIDFLAVYSTARAKPFLLDTAALFNTEMDEGDSELAIKQTWWRQVIAQVQSDRLAGLGMLLWSETRRPEAEAGGDEIDWGLTGSPEVASAFRQDLTASGTLLAHPDVDPPTARIGVHRLVRIVLLLVVIALGGLVLLGVAFPRRLGWSYVERSDGRDLRVDFLRGLAMTFVVVDHIGMPSLYHLISHERIGTVSGAELFVFFSGGVLGLVYRRRIARDGWTENVRPLLLRARTLYATAVGVSLVAYALTFVPRVDASMLTTWTDHGTSVVYQLYPSPRQLELFAPSVLLLRSGPSQSNILGLYVVLLIIAPVFLGLLAAAQAKPPAITASPAIWWFWNQRRYGMIFLLAVSWGLYLLEQIHLVRLFDAQFEAPFPLLAWQVLFVTGMTAGYYRAELLAWFRTTPGRVTLVACVLLAIAGALLSWSNPYLESTWDVRLRIVSPNDFATLSRSWFDRAQLAPGRLLNVFVAVVALYALLSICWRPLDRLLGWFLIPIGAATLYVFVLQVFFAMIVANIPLFQRENVPMNTLGHTAVLLICWLMVKRKILFRVIPR